MTTGTVTAAGRLRKRFTGFLLCAGLLFTALFVAGDNFDGFSRMLTGLYMLYLGGQTATDWKNASVAAAKPPG